MKKAKWLRVDGGGCGEGTEDFGADIWRLTSESKIPFAKVGRLVCLDQETRDEVTLQCLLP